jgi:phosphatidate cytidylyltransferase
MDLINLKKRVLVATAILIPLALLFMVAIYTNVGGVLLAVVAFLTVGLAWYEWSKFDQISSKLGKNLTIIPVAVTLLVIFYLKIFCSDITNLKIASFVFVSGIVATFTVAVIKTVLLLYSYDTEREATIKLSQLLAPVMFTFGGSGLVALTAVPMVLIWGLLVVIATDTMAYFAGNLLGKNRLIPLVSPGKTIEGTIIGTVCGSGVGLLFFPMLPINNCLILSVVVATSVSLIAQLGDLVESYVKRVNGVKDSGNLLPGHGGVFDRIDATLGMAVLLGMVVVIIQ